MTVEEEANRATDEETDEPETERLGHHLSSEDIKPVDEKCMQIQKSYGQ